MRQTVSNFETIAATSGVGQQMYPAGSSGSASWQPLG